MYIAMNWFRVVVGEEAAFEERWRKRELYLDQLPGFVEFHLLRGPKREDYTLFASHTVWASREDFLFWTQSEQFRVAHSHASGVKALHLGHPEFEGFEVVQTQVNLRAHSAAASGAGGER